DGHRTLSTLSAIARPPQEPNEEMERGVALAGRGASDRHLLFQRVRLRQGSANCTSGRAANDRRRSRPELLKERRKATIRMPTIISHGVSALAIGNVFPHGCVPFRFWILSIFC